jgi:hypothetical protein
VIQCIDFGFWVLDLQKEKNRQMILPPAAFLV